MVKNNFCCEIKCIFSSTYHLVVRENVCLCFHKSLATEGPKRTSHSMECIYIAPNSRIRVHSGEGSRTLSYRHPLQIIAALVKSNDRNHIQK